MTIITVLRFIFQYPKIIAVSTIMICIIIVLFEGFFFLQIFFLVIYIISCVKFVNLNNIVGVIEGHSRRKS